MERTAHLFTSVVLCICFAAGTAGAKCIDARAVDPNEFDTPQDNLYFPMAIGTTYVYMAEDDDELILNEVTISTDTEVVMGVTCVVVYDVEWVSLDEGDTWILLEDTADWYAWDNDGNVRYFGEDTLAYVYDDEWNFLYTTDAGSWRAGDGEALPGIVMLAEPSPGVCYQQEYLADEAEDYGKVKRLGVDVSIELDDYEDCLKTKEWTPLEPGSIENKYYAPGVGLVFIEELKGKTVRVELVEIID